MGENRFTIYIEKGLPFPTSIGVDNNYNHGIAVPLMQHWPAISGPRKWTLPYIRAVAGHRTGPLAAQFLR
jgi:hypothetical protein